MWSAICMVHTGDDKVRVRRQRGRGQEVERPARLVAVVLTRRIQELQGSDLG